jgi:Arc/MetJ family transcription regulator
MDDMKTHIDIDEELLTKAIKLGRHRSKRAAVQAALQAYVSWQLRKQLLDLQGKIRWEGDLDQMRGRIKETKS